MLGVNHCIVRDGSPILSRMRGLSHYFQAPVPNPLNFGWARAMLDDVRSSGQSVLLTATEGNFTISFGGMLALPALLRGGRWLRWLRETRDMVRNHAHLRWRGALYASFEPFLPIACLRVLQAAFNRREYLSEFDFVNPALDSGPPPLPGRLSGNLLRDRVYLLSFHDNGERFKGMTALTGVEERDPTNDRRLVEFCLSMEPEHLLQRGEPRPLAREAFADRMNPRVFDASTRGLQSADWFARMSQSEARDILDEIRATSAADVIDIPKLEGAINRWPEFKPNAFAELFPFGRGVSQALNVGLFVAETERHGGRG
jgi:asparagine synthase (glutamine-hydrolysing)